MKEHEKINYIELPSSDLAKTKKFFEKVFEWTFESYGPEYSAFFNAGIDGGFYQSDLKSLANKGSALIVFYSENLEATQTKIEAEGGVLEQKIFSFPGGKRFHFTEPCGNEFAVWSENTTEI